MSVSIIIDRHKKDALSLHDREEVSDCVAVRGCEHEQPCKAPHFRIGSVFEIGTNFEGFRYRVGSIFLNCCNDKGCFALGKEAPRLLGEFGEVNDEEVAGNTSETGEKPFHLNIYQSPCA